MPFRNLSLPAQVGPGGDPASPLTPPPHALEDRILEHVPRLRAFLRKLSGSAHDTEDLLQDTLERSLRHRRSFDPGGSLSGWLTKTAFRCYLDLREKRRREPSQLGDAAEMVRARNQPSAEARDLIGQLLRRLAPIEQDIVLRFHHRRESIAEIGDALGMPVNTVKSHLHRARRKLSGGEAS